MNNEKEYSICNFNIQLAIKKEERKRKSTPYKGVLLFYNAV
jgi:hypothetical protein